MKTVSKIAIFSTLLAGTLTVGAHPNSGQRIRGQQQGRPGPTRQFQEGQQSGGQHRYAQSRQPCNKCQRRESAAQNPRGRKGAAQQQVRGQRGANSQKPDRANNKRRQARLERFDTDKDGQLSTEERQSMRERTRGNPGSAPRRPTTPPVDE
jgi:hypothetical protein